MTTMNSDEFDEFKALMDQHGLKHVHGQQLNCIKFAKPALSVETCNSGETFEVTHGDTIYISPSLTDLGFYLDNLAL